MEQVVRAIEQKSFIRELKQRRRRRQRERQKGNKFRLAKQQLNTCLIARLQRENA